MRRLLLFFGFQLVIFFGHLEAEAASPTFSVCVQTALNELGYEAGFVDGVLGKQSRAAAGAYLLDHPVLYDAPELSNETAVDWCLLLGLLHRDELPPIAVIFAVNGNPTNLREKLRKIKTGTIVGTLKKLNESALVSLRSGEWAAIVTVIIGNTGDSPTLSVDQYTTKGSRNTKKYNLPSYAWRDPIVFADGSHAVRGSSLEYKLNLDGEKIGELRMETR